MKAFNGAPITLAAPVLQLILKSHSSMSDPRRDPDYLEDILEAVQRILTYSQDLHHEDFLKDQKTQDAVIRNLEVIGEATKNISANLKQQYPQLPWREMAAVRDRLIHHYFGVNIEIVWEIVQQDLPQILPQLVQLLSEIE